MSSIYRWANLCILALFLLVNDSTSQLSHESTFKRMSKCPTVNAKLHREKLSSIIECSFVCSGEMSCNKFHFDPVTKSCYLGDACSILTQWADGDCESFQYTELLSAAVKTGIKNPLFEQLQMKLFYKFKSSGLLNEVNPRQFCLAANNVTVDSNGAHFRGNTDSYLSTETPDFEQFLDNGNVFSFYFQLRHTMDSTTVYHRFQQCNASGNLGNALGKTNSFMYANVFWTKGGLNRVYSQSQNFVTPNGQSALLSAGYAYNRTAIQHFYSSFNQTLLAAILFPAQSSVGSTSASNFQCLRLGYHTVDDRCLNGTMYCYGMSTKILSFEDYKLLDGYCNT